MVLYDAPDCWKCVEVKDALAALGLGYEAVTVRGDPAARAALVAAQGEPPQVPMLVDGDLAVWDRRRILAYLAQTYGGESGGTPFRELPAYVGGVCSVGGACSAASPGEQPVPPSARAGGSAPPPGGDGRAGLVA